MWCNHQRFGFYQIWRQTWALKAVFPSDLMLDTGTTALFECIGFSFGPRHKGKKIQPIPQEWPTELPKLESVNWKCLANWFSTTHSTSNTVIANFPKGESSSNIFQVSVLGCPMWGFGRFFVYFCLGCPLRTGVAHTSPNTLHFYSGIVAPQTHVLS